MSRWFNALIIDKPIIIRTDSWIEYIENNWGLVTICCIAAILHIYPLFNPILIIGDETQHIQGLLYIYDYIDVSWHKIFQLALWIVIALALISRTMKRRLNEFFSVCVRSNLIKYISILLFFSFLISWFFFLKDINYIPAFIRHPPVSKILNFLSYSAFGINRMAPRTVQLLFYLLCAIYLYRTINLFYEKDAALIGAVLYLFLPIPFAYAHLAELTHGTVFFIVACSFYFLRFIKDEDNRDLIIATYLIGAGCMYKKLNMLMFVVCVTFFIARKIKDRDHDFLMHVKVLSVALVPMIPWMILTRNFNWRNYVFALSNFTSLDAKIVTYLSLISSNVSEIISILAVLSVSYICFFKRNTLTIYFGLLFIVYYFFIVSDIGYLSPRFSMAFYPTMIVFLSLFISRIIQAIKWKHTFKLSFIVLSIYLIIISSVSPLNDRYLTIMNRKLHYYPSEKAMKWIKENVKSGEKIITVRIMSFNFYRVKYGIDKNKIIGFWYGTEDISTPKKLKEFYTKNKASYIMFPYSTEHLNAADILSYLKHNKDKEFMEVEKFNLDNNFIYVYKLKEI